ncbi:Myotubularin-associated protein, putative [Leishmania donovani]|uniref:Myotubularin-associated protein, putative n=1 Tax=Leishmania donovani TaxID=5661 RepID=A0A3S7WRG7_LEIDO|nr:Myotubularin-associated protein, putative [Leishmania donovani]
MASTLVHDLQQFRYVTAFTCPVPWTHVRHVSIPELRHEAPDLPFMASLISALSDCDVSLHEIHDHNDADILQLVQVLQVCLQFSLWSQNILKEKLLEVQATHVAKGVSAQQLENLERRYHALEGEMAALHKDRDMLSLGTANLRASLLQMEKTIKRQERQLQQEQGRNAQLVAKLEKALCARALAAPLMSAPRLPPPRESQQRSAGNRHASAPTHRTKKAATVYHSSRLPTGNADAHRDSTASLTSDTSYGDSCLSAEVAARAHSHVPQPCDSVDPPPPPFLDWRTLVRYIIHEEQRTSAWTSTHASPTAARATADERRIERKAELMPAAQHPSEPAAALPAAATPQVSEAQLDSFFAGLTAGVTTEVVAYSRAVAARAEEMVRAATQQRMQETAEAQQALMAQVQAALGSLSAELAAYKQQKDATPSPDLRAVAMLVAASDASDPHAQLSPFSPVLALSNVRNSAAAALPAPSRHASSAPVTLNNAPPTNDSKPLSQPPQASASPLPPSIDSSPPASFLNSFVTSGAALCHSTRGREALDSGSKTRKPLPDFSPDILRTPPTSEHGDAAAPSGAGSDGPRSVVSRADDEDERDVDVDLLPLDSSSSDSSSGSSQSSDGKADGVAEVSHAYPRVLAKPSSAPPMYPNKTPTAAAVVVQPAAPQHPSANRTLSLHFSTRSDMSEGSSHGSSQMLRETRAQLQALLEEEEAAGRAKTHR